MSQYTTGMIWKDSWRGICCSLFCFTLFCASRTEQTFPCPSIPEHFHGMWYSTFGDIGIKIEWNGYTATGTEIRGHPFVRLDKLIKTFQLLCNDRGGVYLKSIVGGNSKIGFITQCLELHRTFGDALLEAFAVVMYNQKNAEDVNCRHGLKKGETTHQYFEFALSKEKVDNVRGRAIGCYKTHAKPRGKFMHTDFMAVEKCAKYCMLHDFGYMMIQSSSCICRTSIKTDGHEKNLLKMEVDYCDIECTGNSQQICGGHKCWMVYKLNHDNVIVRQGNAYHLGCFTHESKTTEIKMKQNNVFLCIQKCSSLKFLYAQLHAGNTCQCSNTYGHSGTPFAANSCNYPCSNSLNQYCGGQNASSVFALEHTLKYQTRCDAIPRQFRAHWFSPSWEKSISIFSSAYRVDAQKRGDTLIDPFWNVGTYVQPYAIYCLGDDVVRLKSVLECKGSEVIYQCMTLKAAPDGKTLDAVIIIQILSYAMSHKLDCDSKMADFENRFYYETALSGFSSALRMDDIRTAVVNNGEFMIRRNSGNLVAKVINDRFQFEGKMYPMYVEYLGCAKEKVDNLHVAEDAVYGWQMSWTTCAMFCGVKNYATFTITGGRFCHCGWSVPLEEGHVAEWDKCYEPVMNSKCGLLHPDCGDACPFQPTQCGHNHLAVSVFRIAKTEKRSQRISKQPKMPKNFVGCFQTEASESFNPKSKDKKSKSEKIIKQFNHEMFENDAMTKEWCIGHCLKLGFKYAALRKGKICGCGNGYSPLALYTQKKHSKSIQRLGACNMTCDGGWGDLCGGKNLFAVHKTSSPPNLEAPTLRDPKDLTRLPKKELGDTQCEKEANRDRPLYSLEDTNDNSSIKRGVVDKDQRLVDTDFRTKDITIADSGASGANQNELGYNTQDPHTSHENYHIGSHIYDYVRDPINQDYGIHIERKQGDKNDGSVSMRFMRIWDAANDENNYKGYKLSDLDKGHTEKKYNSDSQHQHQISTSVEEDVDGIQRRDSKGGDSYSVDFGGQPNRKDNPRPRFKGKVDNTNAVYVLRGKPTHMDCTSPNEETEVLDATITWTMGDDKPLADSRFTTMETGVLEVADTEAKDTGLYKCKADGVDYNETPLQRQYKHYLVVYLLPEMHYQVQIKYTVEVCDDKSRDEKISLMKLDICKKKQCLADDIQGTCHTVSEGDLNRHELWISMKISPGKAKLSEPECDETCMEKAMIKDLDKRYSSLLRLLGEDATSTTKVLVHHCPGGYHVIVEKTVCTPCSPGTYSGKNDETCKPCPHGTYQSDYGMESCYKCPEGTNTTKKEAKFEGDCHATDVITVRLETKKSTAMLYFGVTGVIVLLIVGLLCVCRKKAADKAKQKAAKALAGSMGTIVLSHADVAKNSGQNLTSKKSSVQSARSGSLKAISFPVPTQRRPSAVSGTRRSSRLSARLSNSKGSNQSQVSGLLRANVQSGVPSQDRKTSQESVPLLTHTSSKGRSSQNSDSTHKNASQSDRTLGSASQSSNGSSRPVSNRSSRSGSKLDNGRRNAFQRDSLQINRPNSVSGSSRATSRIENQYDTPDSGDSSDLPSYPNPEYNQTIQDPQTSMQFLQNSIMAYEVPDEEQYNNTQPMIPLKGAESWYSNDWE